MPDEQIKLSFQVPVKVADQFKILAADNNKTPGALTRELVTALVDGRMKLPFPEKTSDIYK